MRAPRFGRSGVSARSEDGTQAEPEEKVATPEQLMREHQGLVRSIAWQIMQKLPATADIEELIQDGNLGLAEAARKFDHKRGFRFTTFAFRRIRGAILDGLARHPWFNASESVASPKGRPASDFIRVHEQDADPIERMSLESGMSWLGDVVSGLAVSHAAFTAASAEQDGKTSPVPLDVSPSEQALAKETCGLLTRLIDALPADARTLMRAIYFEGATVTEAGSRIGIGKSWASRLHAKTLRRLSRALEHLGFEEGGSKG